MEALSCDIFNVDRTKLNPQRQKISSPHLSHLPIQCEHFVTELHTETLATLEIGIGVAKEFRKSS